MKKAIVPIILILGIVVFIKFGRAYFMQVVNKVKGKETTESVVAKLENDVYDRLQEDLQIAGFKMDFPREIVLVGLKEERILQLYGKHETGIKLIKEYPFTAFSGKLGPKLQEGDKQIPEGIYEIEYFNPNSAYYLSLKVSYPNAFDKSKSKFEDVKKMGGDIFIHGKAATIGCIPIGDTSMEEIFVLAKKAFDNPIQVIISPRDFRKNPEFPNIEGIDWELELYSEISKELHKLK